MLLSDEETGLTLLLAAFGVDVWWPLHKEGVEVVDPKGAKGERDYFFFEDKQASDTVLTCSAAVALISWHSWTDEIPHFYYVWNRAWAWITGKWHTVGILLWTLIKSLSFSFLHYFSHCLSQIQETPPFTGTSMMSTAVWMIRVTYSPTLWATPMADWMKVLRLWREGGSWFGGSELIQHVCSESPLPALYTDGSIADISPFWP